MLDCFGDDVLRLSAPIWAVPPARYADFASSLPECARNWLKACAFTPKVGAYTLLPQPDGTLAGVLVVVAEDLEPWGLAMLPKVLPGGRYRVEADWTADQHRLAALGWGLGAYRFDRYKAEPPDADRPTPVLVLDRRVDAGLLEHQVRAIGRVRDLVNTPACDLMPEQFGAVTLTLGQTHGAKVEQLEGQDLLAADYPAIYAVGQASVHAPRLIDLRWGDVRHPKVTLVGKGVCFDSGGLNLKSTQAMRLMKKDMGGAAHVLGLAELIMAQQMPIRLRVLIPAVENAVSGCAFRPGDVIRTRRGLSVEIDNTDAEGRVILADALTEAAAEQPELIVDFATLTGAARVALGTELPAYFTNAEPLARALEEAAVRVKDPIWRLPLFAPYQDRLESPIADLVNSTAEPYGGAITAAWFLRRFVGECAWVHFDVMAWNLRARPGRPEGGEAMGLRAVFEYLATRYASR